MQAMITLETYQAKRINFGGHDIMNNKRGFNIAGFIALVLAFVFSSVKTGPIYSHALVNNGITFESQASGDIGDAGEPAVDVVERFSITEVSNSELKLIEKTERYNEQAIHQKETYAVRVNGKITGYLFYDTYSLYNGDLYYYLKYEPAGLKSGPIDIMLPYKFDTYDIRTIEYPEELDQTKSVIKVYNGIKSDDKLLSYLDPGSVYVDSDSLNGTGIEDTATSWINTETGDLHYGYYGNGEYGVKDYPTLTLNDLRYAQVLITTLYSNENPYIRELIETKEKYLIKEGIPF
jgi:hypothetical protein